MALTHCPTCSYQNDSSQKSCAQCGHALDGANKAPIRTLSGKFRFLGVVIIAIAVIGTVLGTWWGPPGLLPGVAFYMMANFLEPST
jgi:hypothetical protein